MAAVKPQNSNPLVGLLFLALLAGCGDDAVKESRSQQGGRGLSEAAAAKDCALCLSNEYFRTILLGLNLFDGSEEEAEKIEHAVFQSANRMAAWFSDGPTAMGWPDANIDLIVNLDRDYLRINEAYYKPAKDGRPSITFGLGDDENLTAIPLAADVVAHELAHHYIYRTISSGAGEAGVLHEAVADFFAAAMTRDSCIGESVCTDGSPYCEQQVKCLRTLENDFALDDFSAEGIPVHQTSKVLSGMLWELADSDGVTVDKVASLVSEAVKDLDAQASFESFVDFLAIRGAKDVSAAFSESVRSVASRRGLSSISLVQAQSQSVREIDGSEPVSFECFKSLVSD